MFTLDRKVCLLAVIAMCIFLAGEMHHLEKVSGYTNTLDKTYARLFAFGAIVWFGLGFLISIRATLSKLLWVFSTGLLASLAYLFSDRLIKENSTSAFYSECNHLPDHAIQMGQVNEYIFLIEKPCQTMQNYLFGFSSLEFVVYIFLAISAINFVAAFYTED